MAEATATFQRQATASEAGMIWRIAWRNLWRNRRRTWLTAGGIAFACWLVGVVVCLQLGTYSMMINSATGFLPGHIQISASDYVADEKLEQTLAGATELERVLSKDTALRITPRVHTYALVSADNRSFGGLVSGVVFEQEDEVVNFFKNVAEGSLPRSDEEVLIGRTMARNLGVKLGDEIVFLGSAKEGGIAALALSVSGIYESGQADVDRTMMFAPLQTVRNGFALGDEVHQLIVRVPHVNDVAEKVVQLEGQVGPGIAVRSWPEFLPDVVQAIEMDRIGGNMVYGAILILVSFSVINTFLMIVFERTREFGMLLSIGMKNGLIVRQILAEAFCMWGVGVLIGTVLTVLTVGILIQIGIPIAGLEEMAKGLYVQDRIYPAFSLRGLVTAPLVLLVGTQLAGLVAILRIRRLQPVAALRAE